MVFLFNKSLNIQELLGYSSSKIIEIDIHVSTKSIQQINFFWLFVRKF
jgi:hypothetical protein